MSLFDPTMREVLDRAMVARIATLSAKEQPSITPLYFTCVQDAIWLGTADWTLAARHAKAHPRVSVLFNIEKQPQDRRILRVRGNCTVRTDKEAQSIYVRRVAFKYNLSPGGILNHLLHLDKLMAMHYYHEQSAAKGVACVIEVVPEWVEWVGSLG